MNIEAVTLREIHVPLVHPFETSMGRTTVRRCLLVSLHGEGITGWGECVADEDPSYSEESVDSAWAHTTLFLIPLVLRKPFTTARECPDRFARIRGNPMAKAMLENALWDFEAQERQVPLFELLGGSRKEIDCGVSLGIQATVGELLEKIDPELAAGYQRIKVKIKVGWDLRVLEAIRKRWPDITLSCDANAAYSPRDLGLLRQLDEFRLLMIEQPLGYNDLLEHSRLQHQLRTSLCLDESIRNAGDAELASELGSCRIVNIKVGRVGGFSEALKIHEFCKQRNIPVWCGGMLETGIGRAHNIALSSLDNFRMPGDVSASSRYWLEDIVEPEITVTSRGTIRVPTVVGRGFRVREDVVEQLTVRKETFRSRAQVSVAQPEKTRKAR